MAGIQQVDRKLVEVARVHGYGGAALVRRVLLPATLPAYIIGLRGGLGLAWMFVVAAEFMGASEGLGFLLIDYANLFHGWPLFSWLSNTPTLAHRCREEGAIHPSLRARRSNPVAAALVLDCFVGDASSQ